MRLSEELCRHFETSTNDFDVESQDFQKFVLCFGSASHAMHQVRAALAVARTGRVFAAHANARVALEFAVTAQWIAVHPDGPSRFQELLAHNKHRLVKGLHSTKSLPVGSDTYVELLEQMEDRAKRGQSVEAICNSLEPNGESLYAVYRQLTQSVHPSDWVADAYIADVEGVLHLRGNAYVGDDDGILLYYPLALSCLLAVGVIESLRVGTPNFKWVDQKAKQAVGNSCLLRPKRNLKMSD